MKIAIGCDEAAYALKEEIRGYLLGQTDVPVEVEDFGVHFYVTPSTGYQFAQDAREVRVAAGEPPAYRVIRLLGDLLFTEVRPVPLPGGAAQATGLASAATGGK